jgi:HSP20 family protein
MREVESLFDRIKQRAFELFEKRGGANGNAVQDWLAAEREVVFAPAAELLELEGSFEIQAAVPGFGADQLTITVLPACIVIQGIAETPQEQRDAIVRISELSHCALLRRIMLPCRIDTDQVYASLRNGMLKIFLKKAAAPERTQTQENASETAKSKTLAVTA